MSVRVRKKATSLMATVIYIAVTPRQDELGNALSDASNQPGSLSNPERSVRYGRKLVYGWV